MTMFVSQLSCNISARETGANKQSASKLCALSLVRQLYHMGVIEAYSGTLKQRKDDPGLKPYPVQISPDLMAIVDNCIHKLQLPVMQLNKMEFQYNIISLVVRAFT